VSLTGKDIGGGIGYPIRLFQLKVISSKPGGRGLGENRALSHSEGEISGILMTWFKDASPSTKRAVLTRYFTGATTSSILG
jgi:hypothetical protein